MDELFRLLNEANAATWKLKQAELENDSASYTEAQQWLRMVAADLSPLTGESADSTYKRYVEAV